MHQTGAAAMLTQLSPQLQPKKWKSAMTNRTSSRFNPGTVAVILASLALVGVLAVRNTHSPETAAAPVAPPALPGGTSAAADPQDATGWREQGLARFGEANYAAAVTAYEHGTALAPGDAGLWSALGEARVMASPHDPMPAPALAAFQRAIAINPADPRARYFLGVNRDLAGDHAGAVSDWLALLADTPPGAPWEADLRRTILQVGKLHDIAVAPRLAAVHQPASSSQLGSASPLGPPPLMAAAPSTLPGPSAEDLSAATRIPPSQQQAMAEAMVTRLESRLTAEPHNAEGWGMLLRSRMTLNEPDKAKQALTRALAADPTDAATIREVARTLGVE
jgi:cytochrome c-type biogenesis protein CcmH